MNARPSLTPAEAVARIAAGADVIDVRQPEEYATGHVDGARLIPLGQLADRRAEVPDDRPVIVVCRSGNRSGQATDFLTASGCDAWNLDGGMIAWVAADLPTTV